MNTRIYLVDDDPAVLKGLSRLLGTAGYPTSQFTSAREFMESFMESYKPDQPGCLVLDLAMPGFTGLELHQWLRQTGIPLPVIFLTGHGDISTAVEAIKQGAVEFLMKPVDAEDLLKAIREALERDEAKRKAGAEVQAIRVRLATLTPREREVLEQLMSGRRNRQIAAALGTVVQTIKVHRGHLMRKMGVQSLPELVQLVTAVGMEFKPPAALRARIAKTFTSGLLRGRKRVRDLLAFTEPARGKEKPSGERE